MLGLVDKTSVPLTVQTEFWYCYSLNCVPQNPHAEVSIPSNLRYTHMWREGLLKS